jgi:hypothetical protein
MTIKPITTESTSSSLFLIYILWLFLFHRFVFFLLLSTRWEKTSAESIKRHTAAAVTMCGYCTINSVHINVRTKEKFSTSDRFVLLWIAVCNSNINTSDSIPKKLPIISCIFWTFLWYYFICARYLSLYMIWRTFSLL